MKSTAVAQSIVRSLSKIIYLQTKCGTYGNFSFADKSSVSKKKKKSPLKEQPSSQELFEFPDYNLPTTKEHDESQCEVEWDSRSPITMCK